MQKSSPLRKKVLFLHKYSHKAAAFRYRFSQYYPALRAANIEVVNQSLLSDDYLNNKFEKMRSNFFLVIKSLWSRCRFVAKTKDVDVIVLYMEALPYVPFLFEYWLCLRKAPYIVDLDDAIYLTYKQHKNFLVRWLLGRKYDSIFKHAAMVFAGNRYLQDYAKQFSSNVIVLPTVVDTDMYQPKTTDFAPDGVVTIGWMGSPTTSWNLLAVSEALNQVARQRKVRLFFVGSGPMPKFAANMTLKDWAQEDEVRDILQMDIGIMPLVKSPFNEGKCGFKLIQYMACGIPVVGSPVGVNQDIVDDGVNGYLASSDADWVSALDKMIAARQNLAAMGRAGREKIQAKYSLARTAPIMIEALQRDWKS